MLCAPKLNLQRPRAVAQIRSAMRRHSWRKSSHFQQELTVQSLLLAMRMGYLAQATLAVCIFFLLASVDGSHLWHETNVWECVCIKIIYVDNYISYVCSGSLKDNSMCATTNFAFCISFPCARNWKIITFLEWIPSQIGAKMPAKDENRSLVWRLPDLAL